MPPLELPDPTAPAELGRSGGRGRAAVRRARARREARLRAHRGERRRGRRALRAPGRAAAGARARGRADQAARPAAILERLGGRLEPAEGGAGRRPARAPPDAARRDRLELRPADAGRAGALHEPRRVRRRVHVEGAEAVARRASALDVVDGVESLLDKSLLRTEPHGRRRAALRDAGDDPRVRARAAGRARRRRGRAAPPRRASTWRWPRRPSRRCSGRTSSLAGAARRRARQPPRRADLGGESGRRRSGCGPAPRCGASGSSAPPTSKAASTSSGCSRGLRLAAVAREAQSRLASLASSRATTTRSPLLEASLPVHRGWETTESRCYLGVLGMGLSATGRCRPCGCDHRGGLETARRSRDPYDGGVRRLRRSAQPLRAQGSSTRPQRALEESVRTAHRLGNIRSVAALDQGTRRNRVPPRRLPQPACSRGEPRHPPQPRRHLGISRSLSSLALLRSGSTTTTRRGAWPRRASRSNGKWAIGPGCSSTSRCWDGFVRVLGSVSGLAREKREDKNYYGLRWTNS